MKDIFGLGYFRVVRAPWPDTRITSNNFRYCGLEPELGFGFFELGFFGFGLGFFGFEFRVSGILPTHSNKATWILATIYQPMFVINEYSH